MRRLRHQHHALHAGLAQQRCAEQGIFPGGAATLLAPAHHNAVVARQTLCHQGGLGRWLTVMQPAGEQQRQATGLGQTCRVTQALTGQMTGLIALPGRITALAACPQHHNGLSLALQLSPGRLRQGRLALQGPTAPLHHNRQGHQPQAQQPAGKAGPGQPRIAPTQPPGCQQHEQKQPRWQEELLEEVSNRHRPSRTRALA